MSLSSRAREALDASAPIGTPEGLLWRAALETLATGETVEPDLAALTGYFASEDLFRGLLHSDELVVRV